MDLLIGWLIYFSQFQEFSDLINQPGCFQACDKASASYWQWTGENTAHPIAPRRGKGRGTGSQRSI